MLATDTIKSVNDGYARLKAFQIDMWENENAFKRNVPALQTIPITRDTVAKQKGKVNIKLSIYQEGNIRDYVLCMKSMEESLKWYLAITHCIDEHMQWGHIAISTSMKVDTNVEHFKPTFPAIKSTQHSLYDQVSLPGK